MPAHLCEHCDATVTGEPYGTMPIAFTREGDVIECPYWLCARCAARVEREAGAEVA